jgi:hypothetical protein
MAQQTAVDWLFIQLYEKFEMKGDGNEMDKILEQAKQMEREQIMNAFDIRKIDIAFDKKTTSDHYYNETYGK